MNIIDYLPNVGLVIAIILMVLFIRQMVDGIRKDKGKSKSASWIWFIAVSTGGIVAAILTNAAKPEFNVFQTIIDSFIFAAGSSYIYQAGKVALPKEKDENVGEN